MPDPRFLLEVVTIPVTDLERALSFYRDGLGFAVDFAFATPDGGQVAQLTPPGSACSIQLKTGDATTMTPGSLDGVLLVVPDVERARDELISRGVDAPAVQVLGANPTSTPHPLDNVGVVALVDPDGNRIGLQQISDRATSEDQRPPAPPVDGA